MEIEPILTELEGLLGYTFHNRELLLEALTHRSSKSNKSYQRLEFVGDRVVNLILADKLFEAFPNASEGSLDAIHFSSCSNSRFAETVRRLGLARYILIEQSSEEAQLRSNPSIQAAVFEAVACAVFLDSGRNFDLVRELVWKWLALDIQSIANSRKETPVERLQRLSQTKLGLQTKFLTTDVQGGRDNQCRAIVFIGGVQMAKVYGPGDTITKNKAAREVLKKTNHLSENLPAALKEKIAAESIKKDDLGK